MFALLHCARQYHSTRQYYLRPQPFIDRMETFRKVAHTHTHNCSCFLGLVNYEQDMLLGFDVLYSDG